VEPTSWALLALAGAARSAALEKAIQRGAGWLRETQLRDGSWPAYAGQREGCWVTALGCLALHTLGVAPEAVANGVAWLCEEWPGEGGFWWRLRHRLFSRTTEIRQNYYFRGWSWSPGTSSWVEPTSYALIVLRNARGLSLPRRATLRVRLGEGMLYDRMCPAGGWNCGNPLVYGVAGEPQVGPTAWALLALQDHRERTENQRSLDWLAHEYEQIRGPGSLALAHICLEVHGRPTPPLEPALERLYLTNEFFHHVPVVAWAGVALSPAQPWLQWAPREVA